MAIDRDSIVKEFRPDSDAVRGRSWVTIDLFIYQSESGKIRHAENASLSP